MRYALCATLALIFGVAITPVASAATFQAESFSVVSGNRVENVSDANASGGAYKEFFTNGTIRQSITTAAATEIEVLARTPQSCGPETARVTLRFDGALVLDRVTVPTTWTRIVRTRAIASGSHTVEVSFSNDYYEPRDAFSFVPRLPFTCDRNLRVDSVTTTEGSPQPEPQPQPQPLPGGVLFRADAERTFNEEWANASCQSQARVTQVTSPRFQGARAWKTQYINGDNSYGERCEVAEANASSTSIDRVSAANGGNPTLFAHGTDSWIAWSFYASPSEVAYCAPGRCSIDREAGLIQQLKQTGSCGTPAGGIVLRRTASGIAIQMRNSAETDCGNATMKSLWDVPVGEGCWVHVLQHVAWGLADNSSGAYYATWVDGDCDGAVTPRPVEPGGSWAVQRIGDEVRILRHTMKDGSSVDHLRQCRAANQLCTHLRNGVYRNPNIDGNSAMYFDGITVGTSRAAVTANAFGL